MSIPGVPDEGEAMTRPDLDALAALLVDANFAHMDQDGFTTAMNTLDGDCHPWRIGKPQGALIVAAVNALPALLAYVRELEADRARLAQINANMVKHDRATALAMRDRCAQACDELASVEGIAQRCAAAVRALEP